MPTLFWTDAFLFLLLSMLGVMIVQIRKREHLIRPWRKVARSRVAMVSLVVLLIYLVIAVLDSIHFYPSEAGADAGASNPYRSEPISLLDFWADPLRRHVEKTYSPPFAAYAYARETIRAADGSARWDFPRLQFGASHLADVDREKDCDILITGARGAAKGLLAGLLLCLLILGVIARLDRRPYRRLILEACAGRTAVPWRAILTALLLLAIVGGALTEWSPKYHVFGTDKVGEDVFYQTLKSIRTGLLIGTLTTFVTLPLALVLGISAGFSRGLADDLIQYLYTTLNSVPGVLLIAAAVLLTQVYMAKHEDEFTSLALRADLRLLFLCLILGITSWTGLCRLLRAETLKLREMEYVQAAQALGVRRPAILFRHILPNVFHLVLISVALDFSSLVLAEAVLSYVNIGVDPTTESWGNMINSARLELARDPPVWWSLAAAFVFMFALVLAANLFADAVRDAFDPRRSE